MVCKPMRTTPARRCKGVPKVPRVRALDHLDMQEFSIRGRNKGEAAKFEEENRTGLSWPRWENKRTV
jgi:hypothetical protein